MGNHRRARATAAEERRPQTGGEWRHLASPAQRKRACGRRLGQRAQARHQALLRKPRVLDVTQRPRPPLLRAWARSGRCSSI